jgi:hypothetical protein
MQPHHIWYGMAWFGHLTNQLIKPFLAQQARSSHYGWKATGRVAGNKVVDQRQQHVTLVHVDDDARSWVGDLEKAAVMEASVVRRLDNAVEEKTTI